MAQLTLRSSAEQRTLEALQSASPTEIIEWACANYGRSLCVTTSFADTVLVHLATQVNPDIEVIFLDTGFHFPETLATMKSALSRYELRLRVVRPEDYAGTTPLPQVWADDSVSCCEARKVAPLNHSMSEGGFTAWLSGVRRSDSSSRARTQIVEADHHGRTKVNPIANWSDSDVARYIAEHDLIVNPLLKQGYESIGCWPCTEPGVGREGRWSEGDKTECGLHLPLEDAQ